MKRIASLLLSAILLPTLLSSCADNIQPAIDTTAAATQPSDLPEETTSAETSVDEVLGFVKEDNGKKTITILTNSATSYEFNTESENGDIVNDAVFIRPEKNSTKKSPMTGHRVMPHMILSTTC